MRKHITPGDGNLPKVDDSALLAARGKSKIATCEEIRIRQIVSGADESAGLDHSAFTNQNSVLIEKIHLAIRPKVAVNGGEITSRNPIQHSRRRGELIKSSRLAARDGEILPVNNRPLAKLINRDCAARAGNIRLPRQQQCHRKGSPSVES